MKKIIKIGLITLFVIFLALQLLLPGMFARELKTGLEDQLKTDNLQVDLSAFPAVKVFWGQVDELKIIGKELVTKEGLPIKELTARFTNLKFKEQEDQWVVTEGENPYLYLKLTEQDLNDYLADVPELKVFRKFKVNLTNQQVVIRGIISFFSTQIQVQLSGDFEVKNKEKIIFTSNKLAVENVMVPEEVINRLKEKLQVKLDLTTLPLPLEVKQVKVSEDKLEVFGPNQD